MNAIVQYQPRLPMPPSLPNTMDAGKWRVLCETTFPMARTPEAIAMAVDYCRARGLDVFKKPVHIVPMWNSALGKEVETVWPGINEIQITAARTGQWAGMDVPVWGPTIERTFVGRRKVKGNWEDAKAKVEYPEWCSVTVYRMISGVRCPFTEPVYWLEAYSRAGGANSELPTDMWVKRPHGQLHKVAKAAALRAAFPEEGEYTAEEMEGKEIDHGGVVVPGEPMQSPAKVRVPSPNDEPEDTKDTIRSRFMAQCRDKIAAFTTDAAVKEWWSSDELGKAIELADIPQTDIDELQALAVAKRKAFAATQKPADAPKPSPVVPSPDEPETAPGVPAEESGMLEPDPFDGFPDIDTDYTGWVEAARKHIVSMRGDPAGAQSWFIENIGAMPKGTLLDPDLTMLKSALQRLMVR